MKRTSSIYLKPALWSFLAMVLIAGIFSCKRAAEKTTEKMIEKSIGEDADVAIEDEKVVLKTDEGTFTTDATVNVWPKEIPGDVPEFKEGKLLSVSTQEMDENKNWVVMFEEVPDKALKEYKNDLEKAGFQIKYTTTVGGGGHIAAEKGALAVMLMMGEGNATVTIGTNE